MSKRDEDICNDIDEVLRQLSERGTRSLVFVGGTFDDLEPEERSHVHEAATKAGVSIFTAKSERG